MASLSFLASSLQHLEEARTAQENQQVTGTVLRSHVQTRSPGPRPIEMSHGDVPPVPALVHPCVLVSDVLGG